MDQKIALEIGASLFIRNRPMTAGQVATSVGISVFEACAALKFLRVAGVVRVDTSTGKWSYAELQKLFDMWAEGLPDEFDKWSKTGKGLNTEKTSLPKKRKKGLGKRIGSLPYWGHDDKRGFSIELASQFPALWDNPLQANQWFVDVSNGRVRPTDEELSAVAQISCVPVEEILSGVSPTIFAKLDRAHKRQVKTYKKAAWIRPPKEQS